MLIEQEQTTQVYWKNLAELLEPQGERTQALKGFDEEFIDIVDYIIRITHRIWEQKNVGFCKKYYAEHCPVHTLGSYSDDPSTVVQNTLKTIAAFPDRSLIGDNVVWRDLGEDAGYYSSHRITSVLTNKGVSEFGTATGKTARVTTIADCICYENKVVYEWLMRDNSFLVKQLGLHFFDTVKHFASFAASPEFYKWKKEEVARVKAGQATKHQWSTPVNEELAQFAIDWINTFFNLKDYGAMKDFYHLNAKVQWPGGVEAVGILGIRGVFIQWLAQCADAKATCDHIAVVPFEDKGIDIAIRWSLAATFTARDEAMLPYSGQDFFILAASHLRIIDGKISQEWTVFDEIAAYANLMRDFNNGGSLCSKP